MRIALLPDDYLPSSKLVHAKMFHELAHEIMSRGHEVVVVTPGSPNQSSRLVVEVVDGVEVWLFRSGRTRGVGKVRRAINESLFSLNAWLAIRGRVKLLPFDMYVNYSPTIFFGPLLWLLKNKSTYVYLILRDMFPQWIIDEGIISKNSPIAYYFRFFEKLNYKVSDCIGLMSEANVKYFKGLHKQAYHLDVLHNWASTTPYSDESKLVDVRKQFGLSDKVIFFYGGNMGHAQDMANLLRLVNSMASHPRAHFLFVGEGDEVELVKQRKKNLGLSNLTYAGAFSQDAYKAILKQVDVGLFSLAKSHKAHNFPGKLLGYMVESLPILGSVNPGNDVVDYINATGAGHVFENGQDANLLQAALRLLENDNHREVCGAHAKLVLEENFSVQSAASKILFKHQQMTAGKV